MQTHGLIGVAWLHYQTEDGPFIKMNEKFSQ